ncbi:putative transcription factor interactor and regulator CCHC(Zn) family [Helianthus anomalus]
MIGSDIAGYIQRFHDLSRVVPYLVEPEFKRIERFIWGLAPEILSMVTSSKPPTISEAIDLAVALTEEALRLDKFSKPGSNKKETHVESSSGNKRKFSNLKKGTQANNDNWNANKRREVNPTRGTKAYGATNEASGKGYLGSKPKCDKCKFHHNGRCPRAKCDKCGKEGHNKETCWVGTGGRNTNRGGNNNNNHGGNNNNNNQGRNGNGRGQGCFGCGDLGHFLKDCPKENQARGRVFTIGAREARQDPNVVTGTLTHAYGTRLLELIAGRNTETNETWVLVFTMKLLEYKSSMSSLLEGLVHISHLQ